MAVFEGMYGIYHRLTHRCRHIVPFACGDHVGQVVVTHGAATGTEIGL